MFATRLSTISLALSGALGVAAIATTAPALAVTQPSHPSCASRYSAPEMSGVFAPQRPQFAVDAGYFGTTAVRVDLDANGAVMATTVMKTSGFQVLDNDALRTIRTAKFVPEKADCQGIPGSYEADVSYDE